jgi:hypothetical protein
MSKSILVFFNSKPFGVFSNKTNAMLAIQSNFDMSDLCIYSEKKEDYLDISYGLIAQRLKKQNKVFIVSRKAMDNAPPDTKVSPVVHIFQFITNVANDGKLYKSSEEENIESEAIETEQIKETV